MRDIKSKWNKRLLADGLAVDNHAATAVLTSPVRAVKLHGAFADIGHGRFARLTRHVDILDSGLAGTRAHGHLASTACILGRTRALQLLVSTGAGTAVEAVSASILVATLAREAHRAMANRTVRRIRAITLQKYTLY